MKSNDKKFKQSLLESVNNILRSYAIQDSQLTSELADNYFKTRNKLVRLSKIQLRKNRYNRCYHRRQEVTLPTAINKCKRYSSDELDYIKKNHRKFTDKELALKLHRSIKGILNTLTRYNLRSHD